MYMINDYRLMILYLVSVVENPVLVVLVVLVELMYWKFEIVINLQTNPVAVEWIVMEIESVIEAK